MTFIIESIIHGSFPWTIPLVFFFVSLDIILVYYLKKKNLAIKNKYFEFHVRFGFHKLNILKILFALLNFWQASRPVRYNPLGFFLSILIYSCIVLKLLFDLLKEVRPDKRKITGSSSNISKKE